MPERPEKVKVGPYDVSVETLDHVSAIDLFGRFNALQLTLMLAEEFKTPQQEGEIFLHELCHAVWWERGLKHKEEENIVLLMARGLAQVIRDNPAVFDWLRSKLA